MLLSYSVGKESSRVQPKCSMESYRRCVDPRGVQFNGATVGGIEKDDRSGGKWTVGRTSSTLCRYYAILRQTQLCQINGEALVRIFKS